jgi:two-component system nitrogen regulation response regulator GlnG
MASAPKTPAVGAAVSLALPTPNADVVNPSGSEPAASSDLAALAQALFHWARQDNRRKIIPAVERELIMQALRETQGNQVHTARLLGITRATLRKRIEKFGIKRAIAIR